MIVLLAVALITVVADADPSRLQSDIHLSMSPDGQIRMAAGAVNTGRATYPGTNVLDAWVTITEQGTDWVATRSSYNFLPNLGAMESAYPYLSSVHVKPGSYRLTIVSERMQSINFEMRVEEKNGVYFLYAPSQFLETRDENNLVFGSQP